MDLIKYVGRTVEVIYEDNKGDITQRQVHVNRVTSSYVFVFCMAANAPRTLKIDHILAIKPRPVTKRAI